MIVKKLGISILLFLGFLMVLSNASLTEIANGLKCLVLIALVVPALYWRARWMFRK